MASTNECGIPTASIPGGGWNGSCYSKWDEHNKGGSVVPTKKGRADLIHRHKWLYLQNPWNDLEEEKAPTPTLCITMPTIIINSKNDDHLGLTPETAMSAFIVWKYYPQNTKQTTRGVKLPKISRTPCDDDDESTSSSFSCYNPRTTAVSLISYKYNQYNSRKQKGCLIAVKTRGYRPG